MKGRRKGREDVDDQAELSARHSAEMGKLEQSHRDEALAMVSRQRVQVLALERQQVIEQMQLWKRQGRQLGPGPQALLEGRAGR